LPKCLCRQNSNSFRVSSFQYIFWEIKGTADIGLDKVLASGDSTNETIKVQRIFLCFITYCTCPGRYNAYVYYKFYYKANSCRYRTG
jgi:hypothetical protein